MRKRMHATKHAIVDHLSTVQQCMHESMQLCAHATMHPCNHIQCIHASMRPMRSCNHASMRPRNLRNLTALHTSIHTSFRREANLAQCLAYCGRMKDITDICALCAHATMRSCHHASLQQRNVCPCSHATNCPCIQVSTQIFIVKRT